MASLRLAERFEGVDKIPAVVNAVTVVGLGLVAIPVLLALHLPIWWPSIIVVLVGVLAAGRRYRLTISPDGIELVTLRFYVVPAERERWLLDARVELYESLDAPGPEGLCVEERLDAADRKHPVRCFGPSREESLRALWRAASAALDACRAAAPPCPPTLRHPQLGAQSARLAIAEATRHPSGRLATVVSVGPVHLGAMELPAGSQLRFNDDSFVDPRREDRLVSIRVSAPVVVFGRTTNALAVIGFHGGEHPMTTSEAFDTEVDFDGIFVNGRAVIGFSRDGRMTSFTLARATPIGAFTIPAGSKLHYWDGLSPGLLAGWTCFLAAPLALPEVTLAEGESCRISSDLSRLVSISPNRDVVLPDVHIRGGIMPLPVSPQGLLDRAACRKLGLLST